MPEHELEIAAILQTLDNGGFHGEALLFPEFSCLGDSRETILRKLEKIVQAVLEEEPRGEWHRRHLPATVDARDVPITVPPPKHGVAWRTPVEVNYQAVCWSQGEILLAYLPALRIEVSASRPEELAERLLEQAAFALQRQKATVSLRQCFFLARGRNVAVERRRILLPAPTPKQAAMEEAKESEPDVKTLKQTCDNLTRKSPPPAFHVEPMVEKLADALTGRAPSSVLLTGPSGVGKTALFHELVRRRRDFQLGATPFWATSGSRLIAGMSGFGMWQERCRDLVREASKQRAILHLGNLIELMEVGKGGGSGLGVAGFLRPLLSRGELLAVVECTPEQRSLVEREDPQLLDALYPIEVKEPSPETGRLILWDYLAENAPPGETPLTEDGLEILDRLHRRYAAYSSYPGRPLRFLKNLLADRDRGETWSARDVVAAFARETGLPRFLLDDSVPLDLQASRDWFAGRVVGQARATDLIVELTAAVKTGLSRPGRPIASLLFIGPTGVGKTETAKALAEFFYQDKNRMARFDMSEYADPISVKQLVGGVFGSEGALTSKVREQPFGVVLLDEFEKAHPLFFDLLLQILGEGRLTDAGGRAADFSNSVIVMTSNLGAEQYMQGAAGFRKEDAAEAERATEHFLRRVREFLRPELFNRIDRVVPFLPLDQDAVLNIARRELELVQQRDGLRYREVELEFGPEVAAVLAKAGHDPRYGARPLKRAMERSLLGPLAEGLNHYAARLPLAAQVETQGPSLTVQVRARPASDSRSVRRREELSRLAATKQCVQLRRDAQALEHCPAAVEVRNDVFRLERMKQKLERKGNHKAWQDPALAARLATLPQLQAMAKRLNSFRDDCFRLEDDVLLAFHEQQDGNGDGKATSEGQDDAALATSEWERLTRERQNLILDLYALQYEDADRAVLVAYSEHPTWMFTLAKAYYWIAGATGATAKLFALKPYRKGLVPPPSYVLPPPPDDEGKRKSRTASKIDAREGDPRGNDPRDDSSEDDPSAKRAGKDKTKITRLDAFYVKDPERYLEQPRDGVVGVALVVEGELAFPRLEPEQGLHVFQVNGKAQRCRVQVSRAKLEDYQPPPGVDRKGGIPDGDPRRVLHPELRKAEDPILRENNLSWAAGEFHEMLADLVQERLLIEAKSLIQL